MAQLDDTGMVTGIFAFPLDIDKAVIWHEDYSHELQDQWKSDKDGVYYLGKTLEGCHDSKWRICYEMDKVEIVCFDDGFKSITRE